jgi:hypothetical protein
VAVLALEHFDGPKPDPSYHAAHLDGDNQNNRIENLKWCTPVENSSHRYIHGTVRYRAQRIIEGDVCYQCRRCLAWLPSTKFYKLANPQSVCGRVSECPQCFTVRRRLSRRARSMSCQMKT